MHKLQKKRRNGKTTKFNVGIERAIDQMRIQPHMPAFSILVLHELAKKDCINVAGLETYRC